MWIIISMITLVLIQVDLSVSQPPDAVNCTDHDDSCPVWAKSNRCGESSWMRINCRQSCELCNETFFDKPAPKIAFEKGPCKDSSTSCLDWAAGGHCDISTFVANNCRFSCRRCIGNLPRQYDTQRIPPDLLPIAFMVGRWRSEFDGKVKFPTIPIFTYGEQLDITISEKPAFGPPSLNYTAFAWGVNGQESLHSEYGFMAMKNRTNLVALSTAMNNGFTTIEEGDVTGGNKITLKLVNIGRISWGRDLPVLDLRREFQLVDEQTLDQRLIMETLTNHLQEHAFIRYRKIFP